MATPRREKRKDSENEQKEIADAVLRNNGWTNSFTALFTEKTQDLNQSFHEGKEETPRKMIDIKLEKLGNIGRREIAMSILPEEFEEF